MYKKLLGQVRGKEMTWLKTFEYTMTQELGLHARPAGRLAKLAGDYNSAITIRKSGGAAVNLRRINAVMRLCIKKGDAVFFAAEGEDELAAIEAVESLCRENL